MPRTVEAVYDGEVLRPKEPVDLEPNTRVRITIETLKPTGLKAAVIPSNSAISST